MSGFNINDFYSRLQQKSILKNNKFLVRFTTPQLFLGSRQKDTTSSALFGANRDLEFWCEGSSIPAVFLNTTPITRYGYGPSEKKPFQPVFQDTTFIVMNDAENQNWSFFQFWINAIINYDMEYGIRISNTTAGRSHNVYEVSYKNEYSSDVNMIVYNDIGEEVLNVIFREAYPISLSEINLNWADNNSYMKFAVSFTYQDWFVRQPEQ